MFLFVFGTIEASQAEAFKAWNEVGAGKSSAKLYVIDLWASWCEPCKESFPHYEKLHQQWNKKGLEIVAVNLDSDSKDGEDFVKSQKPSFKVIYDKDKKIREALKVEALPLFFVLDANGEVLLEKTGFTKTSKAELQKLIEAKLK